MAQGPMLVKDLMDASTAVYNVTAATVLSTSPRRVITVNVISAGTAAGGVFDAIATGSPATVNKQVAAIPATVGMYPLDWQCGTGVVVAPGAGMSIAISLS